MLLTAQRPPPPGGIYTSHGPNSASLRPGCPVPQHLLAHQSYMGHPHNNYDSSPSPTYRAMPPCMTPMMLSPTLAMLPPPRRSPPFMPLPPPAALLLPKPIPQRPNSRFSPPLGLPPLPHLDTSVLARMQPPPPPAVIAAAVLARAASLATKKYGPSQTSPRLPQSVSPHIMPQSTSPVYSPTFTHHGQTSPSPPAPAALALPPSRLYDDCLPKSGGAVNTYAAPDCGDSASSFTLPPASSCRGSMTPPTKVNNALISKRKPSPGKRSVKPKEGKARSCREKRSDEPAKRSSSDAKGKDRFSDSKNRPPRSRSPPSHRHHRDRFRSSKRRSRDRSRSRSPRARRRGRGRSRDRGREDFSRDHGAVDRRSRTRFRDRDSCNRKRDRERSPGDRRTQWRHTPDNAHRVRRPPSRWESVSHHAQRSRWDDRGPQPQPPSTSGPRRSSRWDNRGGNEDAMFGSGPRRSSRFSPAAVQDPRGGREHYSSGNSGSSPPLLHCLRAGRDQRPQVCAPHMPVPPRSHYQHSQSFSGDDAGGFRRRHESGMRDFEEPEPPRKRRRVGFVTRFDDGYHTRESGFRPFHHPHQPNNFGSDRYHAQFDSSRGDQWHDDQEWYAPDVRPSHHGRPRPSKSHHGRHHPPATSSYQYPRHRRRCHRFAGGKHHSVASSSSTSKSAAVKKDAPGTAACHSLGVVRVVTEGSMFPMAPSHRPTFEATNGKSQPLNENAGGGLRTSASIIKAEPSPSPAPERTLLGVRGCTEVSAPPESENDEVDALSLSDFSCDETVIMSEDENEAMDIENSDVKPFASTSQCQSIPANLDALPPSPPLFFFTTSLDNDNDTELDDSSSTYNSDDELSSWEGEFGDDPALPFYDMPTLSELYGCSDDPTDGWIMGLDRNELDDRLRSRRLVSSYSELQNPEVVRSHIRPLTHDLRNLLATLSRAKTSSALHKDDETFVNDFRNRLGDSARMMQRGVPYIGSLYA